SLLRKGLMMKHGNSLPDGSRGPSAMPQRGGMTGLGMAGINGRGLIKYRRHTAGTKTTVRLSRSVYPSPSMPPIIMLDGAIITDNSRLLNMRIPVRGYILKSNGSVRWLSIRSLFL